MTEAERQIAETVRRVCLEAAREAYDGAGMSGLCSEGRWELAIEAIRRLDLEEVLPPSGAPSADSEREDLG